MKDMTKGQAIEAMMSGEKITHRFFDGNEFIYMESGQIYDENRLALHGFWEFRTAKAWKNDWSIWQPEPTEI